MNSTNTVYSDLRKKSAQIWLNLCINNSTNIEIYIVNDLFQKLQKILFNSNFYYINFQDADKLQKFLKKSIPIRGYEQTENPNSNSHNNFLVHTPPRIRIKHHRPQLCIFKSLINTLTVHHHTSLSSSLTLY